MATVRAVNMLVISSFIMNFEIFTNPTDDPHFVELLKHLISRLVGETFPEQIFVMKIDNWFDHKWLNFSGKGRVGFFGGPSCRCSIESRGHSGLVTLTLGC